MQSSSQYNTTVPAGQLSGMRVNESHQPDKRCDHNQNIKQNDDIVCIVHMVYCKPMEIIYSVILNFKMIYPKHKCHSICCFSLKGPPDEHTVLKRTWLTIDYTYDDKNSTPV